jgi:hypothetical protein
LSKPSQIVVLVEDQRQQRFVRKYLARKGFEGRAIRQIALPAGKGSGEQYVREKYADEVEELRRRNATTWLVVAIDVDILEVVTRARQLARELVDRGLPARDDNEPIFHLIPKRNIETWILCLTGHAVDEETDYRHDGRIEVNLPAATTILFAWTRRNAIPEAHCIPSLHAAIPELRRLE